jgi:hypothetical protein
MPEYKKTKTSAAVWESRYTTAVGAQTKQFKRFAAWYDALYAVVGVTPSPWRSKMYIPVLARQTWALVAKFLSTKPGFQVRVNDAEMSTEEVDQKAQKAQRKLEYDFENPYLDESMRDKLFSPLLDAVVTGTGLGKVPWVVEETTHYERMHPDDGTADLTKEKKTTKKTAYNDLEPVNIFNVFVSPAATNLYSAPWIIIKDLKSIQDLKDINADKGVEIYKNLDQLTASGGFDDDQASYNISRNRLMSQQNRNDSTLDMVKIFECYEGDTICTYADNQSAENDEGWLLIREQKIPYWHGKYPLVKFHVKKKPFQFWGEGLFETTYRLQAGYNDAFNHFMDEWNLAENSMLIAPERANINDYVVEPGGVITYRGDIAPQQFKHSEPNPAAIQTLLTLMDQAIEGVTISQYAAGNPNSATDKTKGTATGIAHLQQAAGDIVSFFRANYTQSLTQIGRMWLSNNQQYMDTALNLSVTTKGKTTPMTITPKDMQGDMDLIVDESTIDPANQDERVARWVAYAQQLQQLQATSLQQAQLTNGAVKPIYIDYTALLQSLSEVMNHPNYEQLLVDNQQVEQHMQANAQPNMQTNERINLDINELYGSEAAQLLQRNGIQADPRRKSQEPVVAGATNQTPALTPDHVLKADQQAHQQAMDMMKFGHEARVQQQDAANQQAQAEIANQPQAPQAGQIDPTADQNVVDMAHGLVQGGHLHPSIFDHLPLLPPSPEKPKAKAGAK